MYDWLQDNKEVLTAVGCGVASVAIAAFVAPAVTAKAGSLIAVGTCLAVGFWAGKKITNQIDIFIAKHDKQLIAELEAELIGIKT